MSYRWHILRNKGLEWKTKFFRRTKNKKKSKKINFYILMVIAPEGTKLHILHDSGTEWHFSYRVWALVWVQLV